MNSDLDELRAIAHEIIKPQRELIDLIPQATALRDLFEKLSDFRVDHSRDIATGESRLESGLAISPFLAAMCIRELFRTLAFIRGLAEAISDAMCPGRPVRVLYAGCGPYALLAVPLMTVFSHKQAAFTLLDIHRDCLDSAKALVDAFGLQNSVDEYLCVDAARYRIPGDGKPDVIVSETMAVCLRNEPQVSIARNLLTQAPNALMVPQSIRIDACMLNWTKELVLVPADYVGKIPAPKRDRIYVGKIFELDVATIRSWDAVKGDGLPAGSVKIPDPQGNRYRPYLLTRIVVYERNRLQDYECSLTIPQRLPGEFEGGEELQFQYQLGNHPELTYEVVV